VKNFQNNTSPTLVKTWRESGCRKGILWCFENLSIGRGSNIFGLPKNLLFVKSNMQNVTFATLSLHMLASPGNQQWKKKTKQIKNI